MKLFIIGHKGWIGQQYIQYCIYHGIQYHTSDLRAEDPEIENLIVKTGVTHILSCIGRTYGGDFNSIDYLEDESTLSININDNLFAPIHLAFIAERNNIHLTYIGTGCIYDRDPIGSSAFTEDDPPNFTGSKYSVVKGFTDRLMCNFKNTLNLRIRMPISSHRHPRNFINKITKCKKICSLPNSMSVLDELIPVSFEMMANGEIGTWNFTNPGVITHNEILEMYHNICDPHFTWMNFSLEEQNMILKAKRCNNELNCNKLLQKYKVSHIHDAVRSCLLKMNDCIEYNHIGDPHMEDNNIGDNNIEGKKRLLVTGGCGFIGSNFINRYFNNFEIVVNLDALYYAGKEEHVLSEIRNNPNYLFINGNIRDLNLINSIFANYSITHIIHFAAQSHVDLSFTDSLQYSMDNIIGTHTLLEALRSYGKLHKFIHVSTDEVYGESLLNDDIMKTESSLLCPTNPYASSKAGAEMIVMSYYHSFKIPIIITRGNNVYGHNQHKEKLIPRFIDLLKNNEPVTIQGDGNCRRSFLHVDDVTDAFMLILNKGSIGTIYNIAGDPNMELSVMDITKQLIYKIQNTHDYGAWITYVPDRPFNDKRYYIDNAKLKKLGWTIRKPDIFDYLPDLS